MSESAREAALRLAIRDRAIERFAGVNRMEREPGVRRLIDRFVDFAVDEIKRANGCPCRVISNPADLPVMRVAAGSPPAAMGGAIATAVRDRGAVTLSAVGAAAVNQAVKGVAVARGILAPDMALACMPGFELVELPGRNATGLRLLATAVCASTGDERRAASAARAT